MLDGFDPSTIAEPTLRRHVLALMHEVEHLHATVRVQAAEIQRLRDENNRLKGEQGKPQIKPNLPPRTLSSEPEQRVTKRHHKQAKRRERAIMRAEVVCVDPALLPKDAQFKGYQRVIVQDIRLTYRDDCVPQGKVLLGVAAPHLSCAGSRWLHRSVWSPYQGTRADALLGQRPE